MERALIGFGSNQGDSTRICLEAIDQFRRHTEIEVVQVSSLYRTEPVGKTDQGWFVNGVFLCQTRLTPLELLDFCQKIEKRFGRVRLEHWGPRTLDLDILFFGQLVIDLPGLEIPHPRLHERRFVLVPLVEIAPHWIHPKFGKTVSELLLQIPEGVKEQEVIRMNEK